MDKSAKRLDRKHEKDAEGSIPRWITILLLLIPVIIYLPGISGKIPYPSDSALYTDLLLTHYPNALYLKNSIIEFQQIPFWSTLIHSGAPFAANPLAGVFYLPGWLALLFPLPEGISIGLAVHAVFASWGMYLFLKKAKLGELGAIAGGLVFGLTPKIAAHYGAGHVSMIYAISWTPWLFLVSSSDRKGWKTGITAALLFLADPRWAVFAGIFWLTYDIAHRHDFELKTVILYYMKAGITAVLIASPLIIPLYEYVALSTRSRMDGVDMFAFSLSPEKLLGLILPTNWGNPEWYIYSGGIVFGAFVISLFIKQARRKNRFWVIWIAVSILIAVIPGYANPDWMSKIPVISLLRVPARGLFILGFSFSVIAGNLIDYLINNKIGSGIIHKFAFAVAVFSAGLAIAMTTIIGKISIALIWGFLFLFLFSILLLITGPVKRVRVWAWIFLGFLVIDLLGAGLQSYSVKGSRQMVDPDILNLILDEPGNYRIYSPSYSFPQRLAAENRIEMADGVDPMHIAAYADFMERATEIENPGYSVTIPPFKSGNPAIDNAGASPNAYLLSLLNVKLIISEFEIESPDIQELYSSENQYLYKNEIMSRRAWIENGLNDSEDFRSKSFSDIHGIELSPNLIFVNASGPGKLVLSEIDYPGWKVIINGEESEIEKAYGILRSVDLPAGEHEIQFIFRPATVYIGIGLAIFGWLLAFWQIRKEKYEKLLH